MQQILFIALIIASKFSFSQCNIPYGSKTFTILEERKFNGNKPSILLKRLYSDNTVEIVNVNNGTETRDMITVSGALIGGRSPMFIVGRNCSKLTNKNILYTIYTSDTFSTLTYYLTVDLNRNFISLTIGQKGENTFFVLK